MAQGRVKVAQGRVKVAQGRVKVAQGRVVSRKCCKTRTLETRCPAIGALF